MRFIRLSVWVNHGSTFELNTTFTDEALGAKAAADAGSNWGGIWRSRGGKYGVKGGERVDGRDPREEGRGEERRERDKDKNEKPERV